MSGQNRVYILDTTLRDGQQSPGAGMSIADNLQYAILANELQVDILEAGFPAASKLDYEIVQTISQEMTAQNSSMKIAALCQLREEQLYTTMTALSSSLSKQRARIHIYVPVDPNLMASSLGSLAQDPQQLVITVHHLISMAYKAGFEVEFSAEGYSRMQNNFSLVTDLFRAAISGGARVLNCPDTIGGASVLEGEHYFVKAMKKHVALMAQEFPNVKLVWSAHCHNDLGLALDNTMQAVFHGPARQIEGCINGVGERAGNVALEQCIMLIHQFGASADPVNPFYTATKMDAIKNISDFIAQKMLARQPHQPIVGENAAKHSSGGHTNAIIKNPLAYQPYDPKNVGQKISFVFGPLSGSNHAKEIIETHGYLCANDEKTTIAQSIKNYYAERRKGITDQELMEGYFYYRSPIKISALKCMKSTTQKNMLLMKGQFFDQNKLKIIFHDLDSALFALSNAVTKFFPVQIFDYELKSITEESSLPLCATQIIVKTSNLEVFHGKAEDENLERALFKAFIVAINTAYVETYFKKGARHVQEYN